MNDTMTSYCLALLGGYLLGSIPFGLILTRLSGVGDIRKIGSGNIGATNVLRTGRKGLAATTLLLDGGKGAVAALLAVHLGGWALALPAGIAAVIGHLFPVWLGFRGGKGVATGLGVLLATAWPVGLVCCALWFAVARTIKISSAAALCAFAFAPLLALAVGGMGLGPPPLAQSHWQAASAFMLIAVLVFLRHADNIARLRAGTESRIGTRS
ncbi:putative membrane spanning protein [Granulibacter bethesdensis]|uniref:glycerol-3-phosphate 1-O-acyltransferase PlsY n=1 Tax=Granulibacter bethesdensis TaxID=364410 RepID=UPI00090B4564|nr:glycerol-3-phosphate 1-O-acyltransferase PlsY [Granulibacter bethesdensis]APH56620.1 putative membrane spanning protein [Granulibacter bethesdensis]